MRLEGRGTPFRLIVAGVSGDSGKTLVTLGLVVAARSLGVPVRAFKKGPDYIDAAWLRWATGQPARSLDTYLMGVDRMRAHFLEHALAPGVNVIEGNRGLYDGLDAAGTHSTATLAKALRAPVLLVVDATKMTRTAAACVLGCQALDSKVWIAGVVLNKVGGARHERVLREAIESSCSVPVLGVLPRLPSEELFVGRHMGLVPPEEHGDCRALMERIERLVADHLPLAQVLAIVQSATTLEPAEPAQPETVDGRGLRIGYLRDSAFSFYYPENLEAIERSGACLIPVSSLADGALPDTLDALYIGGGFPETHASMLSANRTFLGSLRRAAETGMPIYAECGGLMLLSRGISWRKVFSPMAGVFPFHVQMCAEPQGHGYTTMVVDRENPFFPVGKTLRGHEFHYSRVMPEGDPPPTACSMRRGTGCSGGRDAFVLNNVWASYAHLHAVASPDWAPGLLAAARRHAVARDPSSATT